MASNRPKFPSLTGGKFDLVAGIALGLVLGLVVAYLLVIVIGGGKDASNISTPSSPPAQTTTGPADRGVPSPP